MSDSSLEQRAAYIVETLNNHQYEAYWVGGFVRDRVLGRATQDIDIATSAKPEQVMALFERCKPTGLQHGTVLVIVEDTPFEVTTFRVESSYDQYRRPSKVTFIQNIVEDLGRRDFTMNAMAIDRSGTLIDPYGGQEDIKNRILRCVGNPSVRFEEDALRMMRCIRFATEYDLHIEQSTWDALIEQAPLLIHIAMERIRSELERMVMGNHGGRGLHLLVESGLYKHFKYPVDIQFSQLIKVDEKELTGWLSMIGDLKKRFALLFIFMCTSSEAALLAMRTMTFANQTFTDITQMIAVHEWFLNELSIPTKRLNLSLVVKLGTLKFGMLAVSGWLNIATVLNEWLIDQFPYKDEWIQTATLGAQWLLELRVVSLQELEISGKDIIQAGCKAGPWIGDILNTLLEEAALGIIANDKSQLIERAKVLVAGKSGS